MQTSTQDSDTDDSRDDIEPLQEFMFRGIDAELELVTTLGSNIHLTPEGQDSDVRDTEQESASSDPERRDDVACFNGQKAAVKEFERQQSSKHTSSTFLPNVIKLLLLCQNVEQLPCDLSILTRTKEYGA